jgi:hypothetical protein
MTNELVKIFQYAKRLNEADDNKEEDEKKTQEEKDKEQETNPQLTPYKEEPNTPETQPPIKDPTNIPVQDGNIPQDSSGIESGSYDALDPIGNVNIKFEQGNYQTIMGLQKVVGDKTAQIVQTFVPLIEVALIELLGNSDLYKRQLAQCNPSFDNDGKITIEFTFQYVVTMWIGQDIEKSAMQHDANYILDKVRPCNANITKCEIDCGAGVLTIMGTL